MSTGAADPTRAAVPDLGDPDLADPDLDAVPDAAASQSTGAAAKGADTTRLGQPATGAHAAPPAGAHAAPPAGTPGNAAGADAAFAAAGAAFVIDADGYRASWVRIQSGFVDDPRGSVTEAAELITQIASTLVSAVQERERTLRGAWDGSGDADTENLRNALRDYRSFRAPDRRVTPRSMSRPARFAGRGRAIDASARSRLRRPCRRRPSGDSRNGTGWP